MTLWVRTGLRLTWAYPSTHDTTWQKMIGKCLLPDRVRITKRTMYLPPAEAKTDILGIRLRRLTEEPLGAEYARIWIRRRVVENRPVRAFNEESLVRGIPCVCTYSCVQVCQHDTHHTFPMMYDPLGMRNSPE